MFSELITRLRRRGVTYEEADEVAKKLGLSYSVVTEDNENETVVRHKYHINSSLFSLGRNLVMQYSVYSSGNNLISLSGPIGIVPGTNHIMMHQRKTLLASFTSKQKLEKILTRYIKEIGDMEHAAERDSIKFAQSELRDVLSNANS